MKIIITESQFKKLFLIKEEKIILNELEYIKFKTEDKLLSPGLSDLLVYVAAQFQQEIVVEVTKDNKNEIKVYIPKKDKKIKTIIYDAKDNDPLYTFTVKEFNDDNGEKGVTITSKRKENKKRKKNVDVDSNGLYFVDVTNLKTLRVSSNYGMRGPVRVQPYFTAENKLEKCECVGNDFGIFIQNLTGIETKKIPCKKRRENDNEILNKFKSENQVKDFWDTTGNHVYKDCNLTDKEKRYYFQHWHNGMDIGKRNNVNEGDGIYMKQSFTVVNVSNKGKGDNCFTLKTNDNKEHRFCHSRNIYVTKNQKVDVPNGKAVKVADVGNEGSSTAAHIHYEIKIDDVNVDPGNYWSTYFGVK
jgi:hypothetical protein